MRGRGSPLVAVVGAGLAGVVAAVAAHEEGADVVLLEQADEPGGAAAWSSGWAWRYHDLEAWRTFAPKGDPKLQAIVGGGLEEGISWLDRHGAPPEAVGTGRPHTTGARFDTARVFDSLLARLPEGTLRTSTALAGLAPVPDGAGWQLQLAERRGHVSLETRPATLEAGAVVLAGGGYSADLQLVAADGDVPAAALERWVHRSPARSAGVPLGAATALGALRSPRSGECTMRLVPAGVPPTRATAARHSLQPGSGGELVDVLGRHVGRSVHDWTGAQLAWQLARSVGEGWYLVGDEALARGGHYGTLGAMLREVEQAGADVLHAPGDRMPGRLEGMLGAPLDPSARAHAAAATIALRVVPGVVSSSDGLRVDAGAGVLEPARGLRRRPRPIPGLFAAGADVASTGLGGTASGLAQALVLGRIAGSAAAAGATSVVDRAGR